MVLTPANKKTEVIKPELSKDDVAGSKRAVEQGEPARVLQLVRDRLPKLDEAQSKLAEKWLLEHEREVIAKVVAAAKKHEPLVLEIPLAAEKTEAR